MKQLTYLSILLIVVLASCSKKDEVITPSYRNVSGVWEVSDLKLNSQSVIASGNYSNNYFMFNENQSFSSRFGDVNDDNYFFGNFQVEGSQLTLNPSSTFDLEATGMEVTRISSAQIVFHSNYHGDEYDVTVNKVSSPTLYRVFNKTSYGLNMASYYNDGEMKDYSFHGLILSGSTGSDIVFTRRNKIWLAFEYGGTYFIAPYPQILATAQTNTLTLYDTTSVYAAASLKVSETELNKSAHQRIKLNEAVQGIED